MNHNNYVYISDRLVQWVLNIISLISTVALIIMSYDIEYKVVIALPVVFFLSVHFFLKKFMLKGIGSVALVIAYAFRMCLLPILCAYGNFYLEPSKYIYIRYFGIAILLMCIECVIVFASLSYYSNKYEKKKENRIANNIKTNHRIVILFSILGIAIYIYILISRPNFLSNHFHFLVSSVEDATAFEIGNASLQNYGAIYYIAVILDLIARPTVSFLLVDWGLKKNSRIGLLFSTGVGFFNILWVTDRRILSLLIGVVCLLQVIMHLRNRISKQAMYWAIVIFGVLTVVYCFLGEDTPLRVARKFQRYFSGPSLTAIGISVYNNYIQTPFDFLKLLFNDSLLLTGLFDSIPVRGYVMELCGSSGYSIWTPMFIGAIQYFHLLAPILIIIPVKFIVYTDYRSMSEPSDLRKMMLNYLTIAISVYMIMYSVELVYYNIIFIGGFFYLLLFINDKVKINIR